MKRKAHREKKKKKKKKKTGKKIYALEMTYLIWSWAEDKKVKGDCCHHVYKEPAFKVMDCNLCWIADHLLVVVHVSGPEVNEYVDDEHDVHH